MANVRAHVALYNAGPDKVSGTCQEPFCLRCFMKSWLWSNVYLLIMVAKTLARCRMYFAVDGVWSLC